MVNQISLLGRYVAKQTQYHALILFKSYEHFKDSLSLPLCSRESNDTLKKRGRHIMFKQLIKTTMEMIVMDKTTIRTEEDVIRFLADKTEFEKRVLVATFRIPKGKICTYKRIAEKIGKPRAYRAVANALHKNPLHPIVPCHRVVRSDGKLGGEKRGAASRRKLVEEEGVQIKNGRVKIDSKILF